MGEVIKIVESLLPTLLSMGIGYLAAAMKLSRDKEKRKNADENLRMDSLQLGVGTLLKTELLTIHDRYPRGTAPDAVKDHTEDVYNAYHGLGMNGHGTAIYRDIMGFNERQEK